MSLASEIRYFFDSAGRVEGEKRSHAVEATIKSPGIPGWGGAVILTNYRLCLVSEPGFVSQGHFTYVCWEDLGALSWKTGSEAFDVQIDGRWYTALCEQDMRTELNAHIAETIRASAASDYQKGRELFDEGQAQDALRHFESAKALDPRAAWVRIFCSEAQYMLGNFQAGLQEVRELQSWDVFEKTREQAHLSAGYFLCELDDLEGALAEFQQAAKFGSMPDSHHMLGITLHQMGRYEEAIHSLRKAVEKNGNSAPYGLSYIQALLQAGDLGTAKTQLEAYERLEGADREFVVYSRARIAYAEKSLSAASALFRQLLSSPEYGAAASEKLFAITEKLHDWALMKEAAEAALGPEPDGLLSHAMLLQACVNLFQWPDARHVAERIEELNTSEFSAAQLSKLLQLQAVTWVFVEEWDSAERAAAKVKALLVELKNEDIFFTGRQDEYLICYVEARLALARQEPDKAYQLLVRASRLREVEDYPIGQYIIKHIVALLNEVGKDRLQAVQRVKMVASGRDETHALLTELQKILETDSRLSATGRKLSELRHQHRQPLLLAVMGEFNAGKSTFINALLGVDTLPMDVVPTTATINVLTYGEAPGATIFWRDGATQELPLEHLRDYVTEQHTQSQNDLVRQIHHVEIRQPVNVLKTINLVDTPGLNAIIDEHIQLTQEYVEQADGILWLFRADQPGKKTEKEFLDFAQHYSAKTIAVLNRIDRVPKDEVEEVVTLLKEQMPGYFSAIVPLSAKQALESRQNGDEALYLRSGMKQLTATLKAQVLLRSQVIKRDSLYQKTRQLLIEADSVAGQIRAQQEEAAVKIAEVRRDVVLWREGAKGVIDSQISQGLSSEQEGLEAILREIAVVKSGPSSVSTSIPAFSRKLLQHFRDQEHERYVEVASHFKRVLTMAESYLPHFDWLSGENGQRGVGDLNLKLSVSFDLLWSEVDKRMHYLEGRLSVGDLLGLASNSHSLPKQMTLVQGVMRPLYAQLAECYSQTLERTETLARDWTDQLEESLRAGKAQSEYELLMPLRELAEALGAQGNLRPSRNGEEARNERSAVLAD